MNTEHELNIDISPMIQHTMKDLVMKSQGDYNFDFWNIMNDENKNIYKSSLTA